MIFLVIPLFLVANIPVERPQPGVQSEWHHGVEFTFTGTFAHTMSDDLTQEPYDSYNVTCVLKCRPNAVEKLLCRVDNVTENSSELLSKEAPDIVDTQFVIKFNETGVESLAFEGPQPMMVLNLIRSFAVLVSVGADLSAHANTLEDFVAAEHLTLGHCDTLFRVTKLETSGTEPLEKAHDQWNLSLWTPPKEGFDRDIQIEKRTEYKRCADPERYVNPSLKTGRSLTKLYISDTYRGETDAQFKITKSAGPKNTILRIMTNLELTNIGPAVGPMNRTQLFEETSLVYYETMRENFID